MLRLGHIGTKIIEETDGHQGQQIKDSEEVVLCEQVVVILHPGRSSKD